ncbi:Ubiquitin-like protein FUBI [Apodemus speciosus]|uniref:Ubiquitin-like protein FUBI n=1 Tax=Apodemus speciosus TaxID=105296 RepID=A0ABQ0ERM9_APOSI
MRGGARDGVGGLVTNAQLNICAQELHPVHTLKVTSQETKVHVTSLEGIVPEGQVVFLAGLTLEDDATLDQGGVEPLTTLEVTGRMVRRLPPL